MASGSIEFWRKKMEKLMKSLRFLEWLLDRQGIYSLGFGTQRKSRIWGTENEFKVSMACRNGDAKQEVRHRHQAGDTTDLGTA